MSHTVQIQTQVKDAAVRAACQRLSPQQSSFTRPPLAVAITGASDNDC